jgi:putative DNA primase/helicase
MPRYYTIKRKIPQAAFDTFPAELRELPIWLLWQYQTRKKETTKVPLIADGSGRLAKTNDSTTWRSFDDAIRFAPRGDGMGVRFVEPYCGIDLDCCRNKETGEVAGWAQKLIERFNSYTEVSPSGAGLHIIIKLTASLPDGRRKRGSKEHGWEIGLYDKTSPRYFCVTGQIVDARNTINTVDPAHFYPEFDRGDWDVVKSNGHAAHTIATSVPTDDKWARLKRGDWQGLYPSHSEADFALIGHLAKEFHNDPVLIDQAFRASGLMSEKWDETRPGGTYGSNTIKKIIGEHDRIQTETAPWPAPLKSSALYGLAGDFIRLVSPETEADPAALLFSYLTAVGSIIGRGPHYRVGGDHHFTNLFVVIVAQSAKGERVRAGGKLGAWPA